MGTNKNGCGAGLKLNYDLTKGESYPNAIGFNNPSLVKKFEVKVESESATNDTKSTSPSTGDNENENGNKGDGGDNVSDGVMFEVGLMEVYQLVREMDGVPIRS
jgi:hypothetical protein